jgi:micrococcal nuclease
MSKSPSRALVAALVCLLPACADPPAADCGPREAVVRHVIDGDTIELAGGERVRYLLIDAPETGGAAPECFGLEARALNRSLVEGRAVQLRYDAECTDRYGRLLAYISVRDTDVNSYLVDQGYACVLHIPPNGAARAGEFESLQNQAAAAGRGLWGQCANIPCE